jgi:hypothetical protein
MLKNSVADALRALAVGEASRSETARLRDVMDDIEAALKAGVSRAAVLDTLQGRGFSMTMKSFESALYRIRKQRLGAGTGSGSGSGGRLDKSSARSAPGASSVEPEDEVERFVPSHDPRDLDRIFSSTPDLVALAKLGKQAIAAEKLAARNAAQEEARKITNPAELRLSRKREINLDDYMNADGEDA